MKKMLQSMTMILMLFFVFSQAGVAQEFQLSKTGGAPVAAEFDKDEHGEWIHWDSGENQGNSIGTDGVAEFSIAHRWMPADLGDYDEMHITMIRFFPRYQDAVYTVKIWVGPDAGEVYSQEVETFTNEAWNEIELDTPYEIDASVDLWYGVHIDTQGGFPAGCDAGPEVAGKGNMMHWQGAWQELTDVNPDLTFNWNLGAFVVEDDNGNGEPGDTYEVTFNVDMEGAVAVGDVVFDPEIHRVFLSGSFAGWAEPGSDDAFELHPVENGEKENGEMLYPGNWENATDQVVMTWTDTDTEDPMGFIFGTNAYGDTGYGQVFEIDEPLTINSAIFWIGVRNGTAGDVVFTVWDYDGGAVGDVLGSKTYGMQEIIASETLEDAFHVEFDEPINVSGDFLIGADISGLDPWVEGSYGLGNFSSANGDGANAGLAMIQEGANWLPVLNYGVDVDIAIFPIVGEENGEPGEEMIYTLTLDVEEGDHEYKYFLVEDEPTWDLGEYEGTHNREITVEADMVLDDVWGDDPHTSVEDIVVENDLVLFPNPATDNLSVVSDQLIEDIRIYDISGRMVMSLEVMDHTVELEVSSFNSGLYIMQVNTPEGVQGVKFNVAK